MKNHAEWPLVVVCLAWLGLGLSCHGQTDAALLTNRPPLVAAPFVELPLGSVHPRGWLLEECRLQADGLTGEAERLYASDLGTNSGWLGGNGESWERGPYYFRGLVDLAYVLDDPNLKATAQKWIEWLLNHQGQDGYLGPVSNNDWWPRIPATHALRDYYEATSDPRVPAVLDRYFHYMQATLPARPLKDWARARAGDEMDDVMWLYNLNGDTNLLRLVQTLHDQSDNWSGIFSSNLFDAFGADFQPKHNVNVEQALKWPEIYYQWSDDPDDFRALELGWDHLLGGNALPCGIASGTEFLSGNASTQGVELCAIVEAMLSLETDLRITGNPDLGDRLETITYNALPAALANQVKAIQYYTLPNNVIAIQGGHGYNQDYSNGSLPGPWSGYPCCRYNFHMGWPKFIQNAWAGTADGGLALMSYAPSSVSTRLAGVQVAIHEITDYPFDDQVRLVVQPASSVSFPLKLRIPGWCLSARIMVNGRDYARPGPATFYRISRLWKYGDQVTLLLPMSIQTRKCPSRSVAISRGPLVYSLDIGERWSVLNRDPLGKGFDEFEIHPTTPWNYALQLDLDHPDASFSVRQTPGISNPFESKISPVRLVAQARRLPQWTLDWRGTEAFEPPVSPVAAHGALEPVVLVPFGSRHLRISWFPYLGRPDPVCGYFQENFDADWTSRWTALGGNWMVSQGALKAVPGSANGAKSLAMATSFTNLDIEADVSVGKTGDAGLVFRVSRPGMGADAYEGYYLGLSAQHAQVELGYASNAWHSLATHPIQCLPDTFYHVKISAFAGHFQVFLNHQPAPVLDLQDDHFSSGMIGTRLYCTDPDQSSAAFKNIQVTEVKATE